MTLEKPKYTFGVSSSTFIWALRVEHRSANLLYKCFYTLNHLVGSSSSFGVCVCVCVLIFEAVLCQTHCVAENDLKFLRGQVLELQMFSAMAALFLILIHLSLGGYDSMSISAIMIMGMQLSFGTLW